MPELGEGFGAPLSWIGRAEAR